MTLARNFFWGWLIYFLLSSFTPLLAQEKTTSEKNVLVLHSYRPGNQWTAKINQGLREAWVDQAIIPYYEYMDAKRNAGGRYYHELFKLYAKKYESFRFDLVVVSDDHALDFAIKYAPRLFPDTPIVFCGANEYGPEVVESGLPITGILERIRPVETLEAARRIHSGKLSKIFVVADRRTRTSLAILDKVKQRLEAWESSLEIKYAPAVSFSEILDMIQALSDDSVVLMLLYNQDITGRNIDYIESLETIAGVSKVPIYSLWDVYLGHGIVGGKLVSGKAHGLSAGSLAVDILFHNLDPRSVPIKDEGGHRYIFDMGLINRNGLDPYSLPANSELINRPLSLLRKHKLLFSIIGIIILIQFIIIVFLLVLRSYRRRYEWELAISGAVVTSSVLPVYILASSGKFLFANEAFCRGVGYSFSQLKQMRLWEINRELDEESYRTQWNELIFNQPRTAIVRHWDSSGKSVPTEVISNGMEFRGEIYLCVFSRDITARVRLEGELRQSQKMEAIGRLAGGIAHDFNNMLQVILGYSAIAKERLKNQGPIRELDQVILAAERARLLIGQLLNFSRKDEFRPQPLDLNELVKGLLNMGRSFFGENIRIVFDPDIKLPLIIADRGQIEQVLMNLCINARDAMPQGGTVVVGTGLFELTEQNLSSVPLSPGRYAKLRIQDSGSGIAPEIMEKIFEPFFTTKAVGEGSGLGLSTVYAIVKRHGGCVKVYSRPEGAIFEVFLPLAKPSQKETMASPPPDAPPPPQEVVTILLAEDDEIVREFAAEILGQAGYRVIEASTGSEAIDIFKREFNRIDLLILDVIMPWKNGQEVYEFAQTLAPDTPVIFCTGYSNSLLREDYMLNISGVLIEKPYRPAVLLREVKAQLDRRRNKISPEAGTFGDQG